MKESAMKPKPIDTAPHNQIILVWNAHYGWYMSQYTTIEGRGYFPCYTPNFMFKPPSTGVWYPVPTWWMELPGDPRLLDTIEDK